MTPSWRIALPGLAGILALALAGPACRNPVDYALEEGVFGGEWRSFETDMVIEGEGNDAVVREFGRSELGGNPKVFKVGDSYLRSVEKTGEGEADAEVAVPQTGPGGTLTAVKYQPARVQITGGQMTVSPKDGALTIWSRPRTAGGGSNHNNSGTDAGTGTDGGTTTGGGNPEAWFLYGYVNVEPTLDCEMTGSNYKLESVGEVARVVNVPYSESYHAETDALEAQLAAQFPDAPSWAIWASAFTGYDHFVMAEYFLQNFEPTCRSRRLAFGGGKTFEEALLRAQQWEDADEPTAVPGSFQVLEHLTR